MSKKYSFIPPLDINNQILISNKNYQIPRPKNSVQISNPIVLYKKGRNNNKRINHQNNSCINENENNKADKNYSNNTIISYTSNSSTNKYNMLTNEEGGFGGIDGIFDLLSNFNKVKDDKSNLSKNTNSKNFNKEINNKKPKIDKNNNNEIKDKIEYDIIEEKLKNAKRDMENVKINIEKLNKKMIDMKNTLDDLKKKKFEKKREIENLLSNKETLEEMYNMEILFIKNEHKEIDNCNLIISIEEIKQININLFKMQVIELIKALFNNEIDINNNNSFIDSMQNIITQTYTIFNHRLTNSLNCQKEIISEFFINISEIISKQNKYRYSISTISSLLHYLIKINCINQKIEDTRNYIKNNYKLKKQDINQQLIEITLSLIFFENQKHEILTLTSKLQTKLKSLQNSNREYTNNNKDNIINLDNYNDEKDFINDINRKDNIKDITRNKCSNSNNFNLDNNNEKDTNEIKDGEYKTQNNEKICLQNLNENRNNSNGGNIEIRYDNNLNINMLSEREEAKNKIYENYINNGIALNDKKKKKIKKFKFNLNSISGNISKEKDKLISDNKKNYSSSFNYNFNTNIIDLKLNKKNIKNMCGINSERKNILILKNNFDSNGSKILLNAKKTNSNNNINRHIKKINNGNNELNNYTLTLNNKKKISENKTNNINKNQRLLSNISNDCRITNHNKLKYKNYTSQSKLRQDRSHIRNSESFLTNYKKKKSNLRLSNFQKYLARSITNSSLDLHEKYKSMNNINKRSNIYNNNGIFKSFHTKVKNISNILINDFDNNVINNYNYNSNKTSKNTYMNKKIIKEKNRLSNNNLNNIYTENRARKISNLNYERKRRIKLSNNSCTTINNNTMNMPNGFYSMSSELDTQLKIFKQGAMESFCYFKIIDKNINPKKYNPLNDCSINPEYFGYNESYISIDVISGSLKISPKISINKMNYLPSNNEYISIVSKENNEFYINIKLEKIFSVYVEKYMQNIIKIQNILLKYNTNDNNDTDNDYINSNIRANKIFSINKIMNKKEIYDIKIEQNEKIKAALCNFFSFCFSLGNRNNSISQTKIDLIFINFGQFNIWLNTLSSIVQNNVKSSKINILSNYNSDNFQKLKIKYNAKSKKKYSESNYKKIFHINLGNEKIRTKSIIQSNNIMRTAENH